ncbi:MAG: transketolase [bacterium]
MTVSISDLRKQANTTRKDIVRMIHRAGSGHPGGSLSITDIVTALFFRVLDNDPDNPRWEERDRFVLSKGHAVPALYSALAHAGYFPVEDLSTLRKLGSPLQGHPDSDRLPAVEACTGSLGQGLSIASGIALASSIRDLDYHTFCLIGDGEVNEGQIWESALFNPSHDLSSLTVIVDYNKYQLDGPVDDIVPLEPFDEKWDAFNWTVRSIDGHDMEQIVPELEEAKESDDPTVIIADTVKGKGVSFMEGDNGFHGKAPDDDQLDKALDELNDREAELTHGV